MIERLILLAPPRSPDQAITSTYPLLALYFPLLSERIELIGVFVAALFVAPRCPVQLYIRYSRCPGIFGIFQIFLSRTIQIPLNIPQNSSPGPPKFHGIFQNMKTAQTIKIPKNILEFCVQANVGNPHQGGDAAPGQVGARIRLE